MSEFFIGRQPVYDRELRVYAYELIARPELMADIEINPEQGTHLIINAILETGIDPLTGKDFAVISLNDHFLQNELSLPLPSNKVILKVPAEITVTSTTLTTLQGLINAGFVICLDNYLQHPHLEPLASLARVINIDISDMDPVAITKQAKQLKKIQASLWASNISSHEEYELCRDLEIDYFQGYFLSRPKIIAGESLDANQVSIMNLLATLHNPETDTDAIDDIISKDVSLSYKILKLINSAFFSCTTKIESIHHAIVMLGRKQLCSWASMMALTNMDDKPAEQVRNAMIRAKSCELMAEKAGLEHGDSFFTVGMFSALDLLMDHSIEELILPLPLADNVSRALLHHEGAMGEALDCALAQEVADWGRIHFKTLSAKDLSSINIAAIQWADEILNNI